MIQEKLYTKNLQNTMQNKPQLFCFTYAGGTSAFFDDVEKDLAQLDVVKLEYAGHGERHKEKFYQDFDQLADDMLCEVKNRYTGGTYAFFGYSMGSIALVEVLKRIIDSGESQPANVFLAAHEPHTNSVLMGYTDDEMDEWVKQRTIKFGAIPNVLLNNRTFWRTYLPVYRADYSIIGKYEFEKLELKTQIPAAVFYSETDTPLTEMKQWSQYFTGNCDYYQFPGSHFFIREHHAEIAEIVLEKIGARI